jgi:hypothetical protein
VTAAENLDLFLKWVGPTMALALGVAIAICARLFCQPRKEKKSGFDEM